MITESQRAYNKKYRATEKGREAIRRAQDKFISTERGRELSSYYSKKHAESHPLTESDKEKNREKSRLFLQTKRGKFLAYKKSAKIAQFEFNITEVQFLKLWGKPCSYCASPIKMIGLDRIDNSTGYTESNVTSCCQICNKMKMAMNLNCFLNHCKKIVSTLASNQ